MGLGHECWSGVNKVLQATGTTKGCFYVKRQSHAKVGLVASYSVGRGSSTDCQHNFHISSSGYRTDTMGDRAGH